MPKMSRTFKLNGREMTISTDTPGLEPGDLALAQVILELAAECGTDDIRVSQEDLGRRMIAKGYNPHTGEKIN